MGDDDGFTEGDANTEGGVDSNRKSFSLNKDIDDMRDLEELKNYYQALKEMHLNRKVANGWAGPAYLRLQRTLGLRPGSGRVLALNCKLLTLRSYLLN